MLTRQNGVPMERRFCCFTMRYSLKTNQRCCATRNLRSGEPAASIWTMRNLETHRSLHEDLLVLCARIGYSPPSSG